MTADELATRLLAMVDTWRVPIDEACRASLGRLVADGAHRFAAADAARADEAIENLRTLLGDMTQQIRIQRFDALHDLNFRSAVERLCPLWPFC